LSLECNLTNDADADTTPMRAPLRAHPRQTACSGGYLTSVCAQEIVLGGVRLGDRARMSGPFAPPPSRGPDWGGAWRRWAGAMVVMAVGAGDCGGGWGCILFQAPWCESAGSGWSAAPVAARPPRRPPQNSLVPTHHRQAPAQTVPLEGGGGAGGPPVTAWPPRRPAPNSLVPTHH